MINLNEKVDNLTEKIIKDRLGLLDGSGRSAPDKEDLEKLEQGIDQVKYLLQSSGSSSRKSSATQPPSQREIQKPRSGFF
jgi:hypothetical protein